jgi:hypothetical protein
MRDVRHRIICSSAVRRAPMRVAMITCTPKPTVGRLVPVSRCPIYSRRHASLAWLDVGLRPTPNARASDQSRAASDRFLAPTAITSARPRATIPAWLLRIISSSDAKDDCRFDFGRLSNFMLVSPMILVLVDRNGLGTESAHRPACSGAPRLPEEKPVSLGLAAPWLGPFSVRRGSQVVLV